MNGSIQAGLPFKFPYIDSLMVDNGGTYYLLYNGNIYPVISYERIVSNPSQTGTISCNIKELLVSGDNSNESAIFGFNLIGEVSGSFSYKITYENAGTGSTGNSSGSGKGGGCFTDDSEFYVLDNGKETIRKYKDLKIGDMILTINGYEPIIELYDMGIQKVYHIADNLKITESQPFKLYKEDNTHTIKDCPYLYYSKTYEHTYDLKVKSIWIIPVCDKIYALEDMAKLG